MDVPQFNSSLPRIVAVPPNINIGGNSSGLGELIFGRTHIFGGTPVGELSFGGTVVPLQEFPQNVIIPQAPTLLLAFTNTYKGGIGRYTACIHGKASTRNFEIRLTVCSTKKARIRWTNYIACLFLCDQEDRYS
jgi:hypothetical protein